MIDNNQQDDEYQFADLDSMVPDMEDENRDFTQAGATVPAAEQGPKKDIRRNALIAIAVVVLAMVVYKFVGSLFHKDVAAIKKSKQETSIPQPEPIQPVIPEQPTAVVPTPDVSALSQKLSDMEANQQSLRADVNGLNNQLSTVNSNINALNSKLAALNQSLTSLSGSMEQQSAELSKLIALQAKPKKVPVARRPVSAPRMQYAIQAIIPGRAWLIAQNGSTLTVRVGTVVPRLGTVRVIDPNLGRVVMSTGQVIRFSQQDS